MFCLINENRFYFYSRTVNVYKTRDFFQAYLISEAFKKSGLLNNNVIKTFILPPINRIQIKNQFVFFTNEINKYMLPYNMLTLINEAVRKSKHDESQELMKRDFSFYFLNKNLTLRDDIISLSQYNSYEYSPNYDAHKHPFFYGCYNNVFITDNFNEESSFHYDLDWIRTIYKENFSEAIDYVIRNHIDRIESENHDSFLIQSEYVKEILVNINNLISLIIDDLYAEINIKYNFEQDAYLLKYNNYSKSYDNSDEDYNDNDYYDDDDTDDDYDNEEYGDYDDEDYDDDDYYDDADNEEYDDYNEEDDYEDYGYDDEDYDENNESDDTIYTSYNIYSYLNFILDKNRGDFIFDLSSNYYVQYSGLDKESYSYSLFDLRIQVMRAKQYVKFYITININADEIYDKAELEVIYKQKDKEKVVVLCDFNKNISENKFTDFYFLNTNQDAKYMQLINEIDKIIHELEPKKINIDFSRIV